MTLALVLAGALASGCFARPPISQEIETFAESTQYAGYDADTARRLVSAYRAHAAYLESGDAEFLLDRLDRTGMNGPELAEAFELAAAAQAGTATADGTASIALAAVSQRPTVGQMHHLLRARKAAALAKIDEGTAVGGVLWLQRYLFGVEDMIGYLEGLPVATSADAPRAPLRLFQYMYKLRLMPGTRVALLQAGLAAVGRKVSVEAVGRFLHELVRSKLPHREIVAYVDYVGRAGSERVTYRGLADGYEAVEDLAIPPGRRLELFEGVVAALASGADARDVDDALRSLGAKSVEAATLDRMATSTLRAMAAYRPELVADAVERAMNVEAEDSVLLERLAVELSRVAAGGRRRPALR